MEGDELRAAIDAGHVDGVRAALRRDPDAIHRVHDWGGHRAAPLHYVSLARFHALADHDRMGEVTRVLLAAGAPPDGAEDTPETPVVTAASYDEPDVAAALVEAGADPVGRGFAAPGGSALAHAVFFGNRSVADVLVAAGAPATTPAEAAGAGLLDASGLDGVDDRDRAWALRAAAVCERLDVIDLLLDAGVPIDVDLDGGTALHHAAFAGKPAAVRHLVERGADPSRRDATHDATPLDWARYRHRELFRPAPGHDAVEEYLAAR